MTSAYDVAVAEALVAFNSAVMALVGYGLYVLLSAADFNPIAYGKWAGALFLAANVAFVVARWRKGAFWHSAKSFTDWQEAEK
jgi:hypothetical protein